MEYLWGGGGGGVTVITGKWVPKGGAAISSSSTDEDKKKKKKLKPVQLVIDLGNDQLNDRVKKETQRRLTGQGITNQQIYTRKEWDSMPWWSRPWFGVSRVTRDPYSDEGNRNGNDIIVPGGPESQQAAKMGNEVNYYVCSILHEWGHIRGKMYEAFEHLYSGTKPIASADAGLSGYPGYIMDPGGAMRGVGPVVFDERDLQKLRDLGYVE